MADSKMFVHYSKTKAEFIAAGLPATYTNHIVFIKGDANGNGSCIYTHGSYFANFAEFLAAINFVKGVKVGDNTYNASLGGGYVAFEAVDPSTLTLDVSNGKLQFGLTEAFVNKVNNTATNLGGKNDAADSEGSAFARIANLAARLGELTGDEDGGQSIAAQINALRTEIVGTLGEDDSKTLETINDELDDLLSKHRTLESLVSQNYATKTMLNEAVAGLKGTLSDTADKETIYGAKKYALNQFTIFSNDISPRVKANEDAIDILNGNDTTVGSVDKKIKDAIEAFAGTANGDNVIENITELLNYVSGVDGSKDLASALAQIETNKGKIETLNGGNTVAGSVDKKVKDAIDAEVTRANGAYATKAQGEKADSAVQSVTEGTANGTIAVDGTDVAVKGLGSAAYTESSAYATAAQGAKADTAYQKPSAGIPKTDLASAVQTSLGKADAAAPQSTTYTKAEVNAMWEWEEL